ncbi:MAG: hypothetical protein WD904_04885 [Dehalococcoidia bacterium]
MPRLQPIASSFAAFALLAAAFFAIGGSQDASASGIWGDATGDDQVTTIDAVNVLYLASGADLPGIGPYPDADCSGEPGAGDVILILNFVAGLPFEPIPGCAPVGSWVEVTPTPSGASPPPAPTSTGTQASTPTPTPSSGTGPTPTPTATPSPNTATPTPAPNQTPVTSGEPDCAIFPEDNWWNTDISQSPVHANSAAFITSIGANTDLHPDFGTVWEGKPIGIPYVIVGAGQPKVPVTFYYDDSDPGPYPIPPNAPVEGQPVGQSNSANFGGDRHVIVVDESDCTLYETFDSHPVNGGQSWDTGSAAIFDLSSNALRPDTWTSADAAGLPIFAGLVRYSEVVEEGVINHALRFTVSDTRQAFIHPATHYASELTSPNLPAMGQRFRMKANYDCSWASSEVQAICTALKKYGMFVADNGSDWYISGAPDPRWDDDRIGDLKDIPGSAFEAVETGEPVITG